MRPSSWTTQYLSVSYFGVTAVSYIKSSSQAAVVVFSSLSCCPSTLMITPLLLIVIDYEDDLAPPLWVRLGRTMTEREEEYTCNQFSITERMTRGDTKILECCLSSSYKSLYLWVVTPLTQNLLSWEWINVPFISCGLSWSCRGKKGNTKGRHKIQDKRVNT